ncbi:MAG: response regulator transcription factor [Pseudorhodoplanes sp.]
MTDALPTVHVVDDDASFRNSVARLLQASGYRVALYDSGEHFLRRDPEDAPGCILLDLQLPGLDGLDLQGRLAAQDNILPIVFLTGHGDIPMSVRAIKAGADDVLSKPAGKDDLLAAIGRAISRNSEARTRRERMNAMRILVNSLTPREREVFALVVRGKMNKQIAGELGTSERTIKAHRHAVMEKLKVQSLAEAVAIAERLGLLNARR